jgi:Rap1a immunity proteins
MIGFARVATLAAAVVLLGLSPCLAANPRPLTVAQYQHPKSPQDLRFNKTYLIGIKDGLIAYNMSADDKMFCLPGVIPTLSFEEANDIIMRWARTASDAADLPLGRALLFGLRKTHPCP